MPHTASTARDGIDHFAKSIQALSSNGALDYVELVRSDARDWALNIHIKNKVGYLSFAYSSRASALSAYQEIWSIIRAPARPV